MRSMHGQTTLKVPIYIVRIWICVVDMTTRLRSEVLFPVREREFFLLRNVLTGSVEHPASYSVGCEVLSSGAKRY